MVLYRLNVAVELDGMLWKPLPGATATAEEFATARSMVKEIHQSLWWNPWVLADRSTEYDSALQVMGQWTRAEPGLVRKSSAEYEAEFKRQMAEDQARAAKEQKQAESDRAERAACYVPEVARARLSRLEEQGILAALISERDQIISRELFPLMDDAARERRLADLKAEITARERAVGDLAVVVGDPEAVCDERGWLPAERREASLSAFRVRRGAQVLELRREIPLREAELKTVKDRAERARLREALRTDKARLVSLEAMPPLTSAEMCPECIEPARHSPAVTISLVDGGHTRGPCPAWPQWAKQVETLRSEVLKLAAKRAAVPPAAAPTTPKAEPIAVINADGPIEEVTAKLAAIQAEHPGARIRRGKRNRWEIWPSEQPDIR